MPKSFSRYVEPFAGSACLFFALKPERALLSDINAELVHAYNTIAAHPRKVSRLASGWKSDKRSYYRIRRWSPARLDDVTRAARFLYLNRYCFNGVYRTNRRGEFNVPLGSKTGALPSERELYRCSVALRGAQLAAHDFETTLAKICRDDFVYLDPPYTSISRNTYGEYGYSSFEASDRPRLRAALREIDRRGAKFLLSYTSTKDLSGVEDWHCEKIRVRRHVAGFAAARTKVGEVLVRNYE